MENIPRIHRIPNADEARKLVETIITPELADEQAKALSTLLISVANPESEEQFDLAQVAMRHAYSLTEASESAFRDFIGYPVEGFITSPDTIEIGREV